MYLESLLGKYIELTKTGQASRLKFGQAAALRSFVDWADRRGYEVFNRRGKNGPAIFCAKCGGLVDKCNKKKGV